MFKRLFFVLMLVLSCMTLLAQDITAFDETEADPNANITFPPSVYTVRGEIGVRGTAAVTGMVNYFIEFRPLVREPETIDDNTPERPWFPATLPGNAVVNDNVLGMWNTRTLPDGLYEIRLTINVQGNSPIFHRVSPLRVENTIPPFLDLEPVVPDLPTATATQAGVPTRQPLPPTPYTIEPHSTGHSFDGW